MGRFLVGFIGFFLFLSTGMELTSFLTSYMIVNRFAYGLHDGIFVRCGAFDYFRTSINSIGAYITNRYEYGAFRPSTGCYWWNSWIFGRDESKHLLN